MLLAALLWGTTMWRMQRVWLLVARPGLWLAGRLLLGRSSLVQTVLVSSCSSVAQLKHAC